MQFELHRIMLRWVAFLLDSCALSATQSCPIFYQCVGRHIFRNLVRDKCGLKLECSNLGITEQLTHEDLNPMRYTAGYVPS